MFLTIRFNHFLNPQVLFHLIRFVILFFVVISNIKHSMNCVRIYLAVFFPTLPLVPEYPYKSHCVLQSTLMLFLCHQLGIFLPQHLWKIPVKLLLYKHLGLFHPSYCLFLLVLHLWDSKHCSQFVLPIELSQLVLPSLPILFKSPYHMYKRYGF